MNESSFIQPVRNGEQAEEDLLFAEAASKRR
jgi:hypothetical protein